MNIEEIHEIALSLPHVTERCPYGPDCLAMEIGGKHFCLLDLSGKWDFYNIKVAPEYSEELRAEFNSVRPGFHMNKRHWVSVDFRGDLPEALHDLLIRHAYQRTIESLPKQMRQQFQNHT